MSNTAGWESSAMGRELIVQAGVTESFLDHWPSESSCRVLGIEEVVS